MPKLAKRVNHRTTRVKDTTFYSKRTARPKPQYIHTVKLRNLLTLSADSGGVIAGYWNDSPTSCYDWSSLTSLFDMYRIESLKVKFIPQVPNDSSTVTGFYPLMIAFDQDTPATTPASKQELLEYENCKIKNMYKPFSVKQIIPRVAGTSVDVKTDKDGFIDIGGATAFHALRFYGDGFDISQDYGDIIVEVVISFKNRR